MHDFTKVKDGSTNLFYMVLFAVISFVWVGLLPVLGIIYLFSC